MTNAEIDNVFTAIRARLTRLAWSDVVWSDFRNELTRIRIDWAQAEALIGKVVINSKYTPTPAHFLEAFRAAQPVVTQFSPQPAQSKGFRGKFFHPRCWAIVRGWLWLRSPENLELVPQTLTDFGAASGWTPDIEDVLADDATERFETEWLVSMCLFVADKTAKARKAAPRNVWEEDQRRLQTRKLELIRQVKDMRARERVVQDEPQEAGKETKE